MEETFSTFKYKTNDQYIANLNGLVLTLIMDFLDPDKKIVYNLFKKGTLSKYNLYTISPNNYKKTMPYSGDVNAYLEYKKFDDLKVSYKGIEENVITEILPFHLDSNDNNIEGFDSGLNINFNVLSSNNFEDDIDNIVNSNEIQNIYLENGTCTDVDGNPLLGDTIYKEVNGNLEPLKNPPYKVYDIGDYNSLVSIENSISSSVGDSKYIRITGKGVSKDDDKDDDSLTALEFTGGKLRTVSYNRFKNL